MSEYYEGICGDGAAILKDGERMTISEILMELEDAESLRQQLAGVKSELECSKRTLRNTLELQEQMMIRRRERMQAEARAGRVPERQRHIANEWADMATNGVQWLRNIKEGTSTVDDALTEMEQNLQRIAALRDAPPPQPPAGGVVLDGWDVHVTESDGRTWLQLDSPEQYSAVLSVSTNNDNGKTIAAQVVEQFGRALLAQPQQEVK